MTDTDNTPTLPDVIELYVQQALRFAFAALPGRVESYDKDRMVATIQPLIMERDVDEGGATVVRPYPPALDVPALTFATNLFAGIKLPIRVGDTVLLLYSSAAVELWKARGGLVDPEDDRRMDISDAIGFIPGLRPLSQAPASGPLFEITEDGHVHIGGSNRLATLDELNDLRAFVVQQFTGLTGHVHGVQVNTSSGTGSTTTTTPITLPVGVPSSPYDGTDDLRGG